MRAAEIDAMCSSLAELLKSKNARYGDSALTPIRIASRASDDAGIRVRIDDKLSRIKNDPDNKDTWSDLAGYIILLFIANRWDITPPPGSLGASYQELQTIEECAI
jgi:hypothetical protein